MAHHIDRWNELLLGTSDDKEAWSPIRNMAERGMYLVFDILGDLAFGASFKTIEPGENDLKKIPPVFDAYVSFNYPVRCVANLFKAAALTKNRSRKRLCWIGLSG